MIEPKTITVDEMKFYLTPLKPLKAIRLDKQIVTLLIPAFGGMEGLSMDSEINIPKLTKGISDALQSMDDDVFEKFLKELFSCASFMKEGATPEELTEESINRIFSGKLTSIYKLAFECMKFNKFTPFELVGGGNVIEGINTLISQKKKPKTFGSELETSEN